MTVVVQVSLTRDEEKLIWEAKKVSGNDVALSEFVKGLALAKAKDMVGKEVNP